MNRQRIKVLIAEDVETIRKRYVNILTKDPDIEVVAEVGNGYEAVMQTARTHPDVILMDIEMEEKDAGFRASREILKQYPNMKIIVLTVYKEDELIFTAFQLGVCDYILKNSKPLDIIKGVKDAYNDTSPIRPEIAGRIRSEFKRTKNYESSSLYVLNLLMELTSTEVDVLYLLSQRKSRNEICNIRHIEMSTLKTHVNSILKKCHKKYVQEIIDIIEELDLFDIIRKSKELI